jgi:hypothetical protein
MDYNKHNMHKERGDSYSVLVKDGDIYGDYRILNTFYSVLCIFP